MCRSHFSVHVLLSVRVQYGLVAHGKGRDSEFSAGPRTLFWTCHSFLRVRFSRMRSEGLLFSFLGAWGLRTVCGLFSFRLALIDFAVYEHSQKRPCFVTC